MGLAIRAFVATTALVLASSALAQRSAEAELAAYNQRLTALERQYPQINPQSPHFNPSVEQAMARIVEDLRSKGRSPTLALEEAVTVVLVEPARAAAAPPAPVSAQRKPSEWEMYMKHGLTTGFAIVIGLLLAGWAGRLFRRFFRRPVVVVVDAPRTTERRPLPMVEVVRDR